jgi:hypothetical protein
MKSLLLKIVLSILVSGFLMGNANAQNRRELRKLENSAYKAFNNRDYSAALSQFLHLDSVAVDPGNYFNYMIGMCYLSTNEQSKALPHLIRAKHGSQTSFVVDYYLGRAYLIHENYELAELHFKSYLKQLSIRKVKFVYKGDITAENRIHMEKSMNDVVALISLCVNNAAARNEAIAHQ